MLNDRSHQHGALDRRIARIAARQHGVFTRAQAERSGATEGTIKWRLKVGRWERLHNNLYRLAGTTATWRQRAIAWCLHLGPRAATSHRAAAALGGISASTRVKVELTIPANRNRPRSRSIRIHLTRHPIPPEDITTIDGIPVTKPARTLLDLAATEPEDLVERCLDDCLRRRLVSLAFLERWLADPRRVRHRGAPVLRRLIDARATTGATESPLETALLRLLRGAGLPMPMLQYVVRDGDRFVARLDFAYPDQRVGIEADGFRYHDGRRAFDEDRARGNELQAMGWNVLRVTAKHVEQNPDAVVAWVRGALELGTPST